MSKWFSTFCCNKCILKEGGTDKNHPGQNLPDKSTREQLRDNLYRGLLSWFFVLGLLKMGGRRCVTYFWGSRDVWQSVTGGKNWPIAWRTLWTAPYYWMKCFLRRTNTARTFFMSPGTSPHPSLNIGVMMYWAHVRVRVAKLAGFRSNAQHQEKMNDKTEPKAASKKA